MAGFPVHKKDHNKLAVKKSGIKSSPDAKVEKKVEKDKSVIGATKAKKTSLPMNHKATKK
jgi:hypothetical protein